jgi:hypothetical protein
VSKKHLNAFDGCFFATCLYQYGSDDRARGKNGKDHRTVHECYFQPTTLSFDIVAGEATAKISLRLSELRAISLSGGRRFSFVDTDLFSLCM